MQTTEEIKAEIKVGPEQKTDNVEHDTKEQMNLGRVKQLLDESYRELNNKHDRNLVLFLGITGAGKSTTINYLMGRPLKLVERGATDVAEPVDGNAFDPNYPMMGGGAISVTLYPNIYQCKGLNSNIFVCDMPGFLDSRGDAEAICTAVNIRTVIKNAKSVKGIVVVIAYDSFKGDVRYVALRKLSLALATLLKDIREASSSIIFAITKLDPKASVDRVRATANDVVIPDIVKLLRELEQQDAKQLSDHDKKTRENEMSDFHNAIQLLTLIAKGKDNIVLIDLPNNRSQLKLIEKINQIKVEIKQHNFKYVPHDDVYDKFERIIFREMKEWTKTVNQVEEMRFTLSNDEKTLGETKIECDNHKKNIDDIENDRVSAEDTIKELDKQIVGIEQRVNNQEGQKATLKGELDSIEREKIRQQTFLNETDHYQTLFDEDIDCSRIDVERLPNFTRYIHHYVTRHVSFDGIPYERIETNYGFVTFEEWQRREEERIKTLNVQNYDRNLSQMRTGGQGQYTLILNNPGKGTYTAYYDSGYGFRGKFAIKVFAMRKYFPRYSDIIPGLDRSIADKNRLINDKQKEIDSTNKQLSDTKAVLDNIKLKKAGLKDQIPHLKELVRAKETVIARLNKKIADLRDNIDNSLKIIRDNLSFSRAIQELLIVLEYNLNADPIIVGFQQALLLYKNEVAPKKDLQPKNSPSPPSTPSLSPQQHLGTHPNTLFAKKTGIPEEYKTESKEETIVDSSSNFADPTYAYTAMDVEMVLQSKLLASKKNSFSILTINNDNGFEQAVKRLTEFVNSPSSMDDGIAIFIRNENSKHGCLIFKKKATNNQIQAILTCPQEKSAVLYALANSLIDELPNPKACTLLDISFFGVNPGQVSDTNADPYLVEYSYYLLTNDTNDKPQVLGRKLIRTVHGPTIEEIRQHHQSLSQPNLTNKPSIKPVNLTEVDYEYTAKDMELLFNKKLSDSKAVTPKVLSINRSIEATLTPILQAVATDNRVAIIALQYQQHWVGIVAKPLKNKIQVIYVDPRGEKLGSDNSTFADPEWALFAKTVSTYTKDDFIDLQLKQIEPKTLHDSGAYTFENLLLLTESNTESGSKKDLSDILPLDTEVTSLRGAHQEILLSSEASFTLRP